MEDYLFTLLSIAVFWAIVCFVIWVSLSALLPIFVWRPKESIRCRKCGYDLRVCSSDLCPECGDNLKKRGVWPQGKPSGFRLLNYTIVCFCCFAILATFGTGVWNQSKSQIAHHISIEKSSIFILHPRSQAYHSASFTVHAERWVVLPSDDTSLPNNENLLVSLHIHAHGSAVHAISFDPESRIVVRHAFPAMNTEEENIRSNTGIAIKYGDVLTPESLAEIHPQSSKNNVDQDDLVIREMKYLIEVAALCAEKSSLNNNDNDAAVISEEVNVEIKKSGLFGEVIPFSKPIFAVTVKQLPGWLVSLPIAVGLTLFLISFYIVRRLSYSHDVASWDSLRYDTEGESDIRRDS